MAALYDFITALWHNWVWFMTGLPPFVAERIAKQGWAPRYEAWIAARLSPSARQRVFTIAAIAGVFVASFLAFSDERDQLMAARQALDRSSDRRERVYQMPSAQQDADLVARLKALNIPPGSDLGVYAVDNPSSVKLAEHIRDLLKKVSPNTYFMSESADDPNESGLSLDIRNPAHPSARDQSYLDAFRLSGFKIESSDLNESDTFPDIIPFAVTVSYPPM